MLAEPDGWSIWREHVRALPKDLKTFKPMLGRFLSRERFDQIGYLGELGDSCSRDTEVQGYKRENRTESSLLLKQKKLQCREILQSIHQS